MIITMSTAIRKISINELSALAIGFLRITYSLPSLNALALMPAKKAHTTIDLANFTGNFITLSLKFGFDKTFY